MEVQELLASWPKDLVGEQGMLLTGFHKLCRNLDRSIALVTPKNTATIIAMSSQ